jgi:hypothetical protein
MSECELTSRKEFRVSSRQKSGGVNNRARSSKIEPVHLWDFKNRLNYLCIRVDMYLNVPEIWQQGGLTACMVFGFVSLVRKDLQVKSWCGKFLIDSNESINH